MKIECEIAFPKLNTDPKDYVAIPSCFLGSDGNSLKAFKKLIQDYLDNTQVIKSKFKQGDLVRKKGTKGQWHGHIVGFYFTDITPIGYAVESIYEKGSVQIYPESALELYEVENGK